MRKNGLIVAAALASLAVGAFGACSIEDIPHVPTFETDIKPIMLSRCVRCHGAGGHLNADSQTTNPNFSRPFNGYFDRMEDVCGDAGTTCLYGLGHYTMGDAAQTLLVNFIHRSNPDAPMPPLPAPPLTKRQLDIIDLWLANGAPAD